MVDQKPERVDGATETGRPSGWVLRDSWEQVRFEWTTKVIQQKFQI